MFASGVPCSRRRKSCEMSPLMHVSSVVVVVDDDDDDDDVTGRRLAGSVGGVEDGSVGGVSVLMLADDGRMKGRLRVSDLPSRRSSRAG